MCGQNTMFCSLRYDCSYTRAICESVNNVVGNFVGDSYTASERGAAAFLRELLLIRDQRMYVGCFSNDEISDMIEYVCTASTV
jgi:hypothetical protein